jgi:3-dehydroquinate synthase
MMSGSQSLTVVLGERSYPIHIGRGLLTDPALWQRYVPTSRAVIVSNTVVAPLYLAPLEACLSSLGKRVSTITLPDGEMHKDWTALNRIYDALLGDGIDRKTPLIALGGGVVGDITGFAAATYQRGVPFIQVPTTLLAQVDSSVGGKTGINHRLGKNMIGAFHQPEAVFSDTDTLNSLPPREYASGLAEIIKHALIFDVAHLAELESAAAALAARDAATLSRVIARSCAIKAEVVARDERETADHRALLNLGHTFGHAIETEAGYGTWLHGEAVAMGTVLAARLSREIGHLDAAAVQRIEGLLAAVDLPVAPPALPAEALVAHMRRDKKNADGQVTLVLLKRLGEAYLERSIPATAITAFLAAQTGC